MLIYRRFYSIKWPVCVKPSWIVHLTTREIWTPDINLYDGDIEDSHVRGFEPLPVTVGMNGRVRMKRYVTMESNCEISPRARKQFPFDYHQCNIKLGSRELKEHDLKLSVKKMNYYSNQPTVPLCPLTHCNITKYLGKILNDEHVISGVYWKSVLCCSNFCDLKIIENYFWLVFRSRVFWLKTLTKCANPVFT